MIRPGLHDVCFIRRCSRNDERDLLVDEVDVSGDPDNDAMLFNDSREGHLVNAERKERYMLTIPPLTLNLSLAP